MREASSKIKHWSKHRIRRRRGVRGSFRVKEEQEVEEEEGRQWAFGTNLDLAEVWSPAVTVLSELESDVVMVTGKTDALVSFQQALLYVLYFHL